MHQLHTPSSPALAQLGRPPARSLSLPQSATLHLAFSPLAPTAASIYPLSSPPTQLAPFHSPSSILCPTDISFVARPVYSSSVYSFISFSPLILQRSPQVLHCLLNHSGSAPCLLCPFPHAHLRNHLNFPGLRSNTTCLPVSWDLHQFVYFPFFDRLDFRLPTTSPDEVDPFVPALHLSGPRFSSQANAVHPPAVPTLRTLPHDPSNRQMASPNQRPSIAI